MTIDDIKQNIKKTIAGKEAYHQELCEKADNAVFPANKAYGAMADMLAANLDDLDRILADLEQIG